MRRKKGKGFGSGGYSISAPEAAVTMEILTTILKENGMDVIEPSREAMSWIVTLPGIFPPDGKSVQPKSPVSYGTMTRADGAGNSLIIRCPPSTRYSSPLRTSRQTLPDR